MQGGIQGVCDDDELMQRRGQMMGAVAEVVGWILLIILWLVALVGVILAAVAWRQRDAHRFNATLVTIVAFALLLALKACLRVKELPMKGGGVRSCQRAAICPESGGSALLRVR